MTMVVNQLVLIIFILGLKSGSSELGRWYTGRTEISPHSYACAGNEMILMCNRTGETIAWTVTTDSVGRIVFFSSDPEGRIINQGKLKGVLLQNDPHSDGSNLRNFRTQLHVYTSIQMTGPINITCSSDGGSNSHAITLSATPQAPVLKEPRLFQQGDSNTTYYLEWEAPSNSAESDLSHYLLYVNDTIIQSIQANQKYAVISLQNDVTATVKIAAADKCGQVSNCSSVNFPPIENTNNPNTNSVDISTELQHNIISNSKYSIASLVLIICTSSLALLL